MAVPDPLPALPFGGKRFVCCQTTQGLYSAGMAYQIFVFNLAHLVSLQGSSGPLTFDMKLVHMQWPGMRWPGMQWPGMYAMCMQWPGMYGLPGMQMVWYVHHPS